MTVLVARQIITSIGVDFFCLSTRHILPRMAIETPLLRNIYNLGMPTYQTTGIIIGRTNFGEADRIVRMLTADRGKGECGGKGGAPD
jgi:hypothetical protein